MGKKTAKPHKYGIFHGQILFSKVGRNRANDHKNDQFLHIMAQYNISFLGLVKNKWALVKSEKPKVGRKTTCFDLYF